MTFKDAQPQPKTPPVETKYAIRAATQADIETIVRFTVDEGREAEGVELDAAAAYRGVWGAFEDPPRATYWVAESADGEVVASTSVIREWSNFRGGWYWWIQSLFIEPAHRSRGLVEALLHHLSAAADADRALDLRLYVHCANERAMRVYRRWGFIESPYLILVRRTESNVAGDP